MSEQSDFTDRNEPQASGSDQARADDLQKFLKSIEENLNRFPEVQVMVPDDDMSIEDEAAVASATASGARRCFRLFPSGRRVCIPV